MKPDWSTTENQILLNPRWPAEDRSFLEAGARHVLKEHGLRNHIVLSSSGTTAETWRGVKLIFVSKTALLGAARAVVEAAGLNAKDVIAQSLPLFHVGGLGTVARARECGARLAEVPSAGAWNPEIFGKLVLAQGITVASLVPTQLYDLVRLGLRAPSSLRILFLGGAVLAPDIERAARKLGWPVVMTYGMTETSAMIAARWDEDIGGGLRFFPGVVGRLSVDGRLMLKAPGLATGWARARDQDSKFEWVPIADRQGWFQSEDYARVEEDRWFIEGRGGDFVKVAGEFVNLNALRTIWSSLVGGAGVFMGTYLSARADERRGAEVVLAVERSILENANGLKELVADFNRKVLPFERICEMIALDRLPRTELGKIREVDLRKQLLPAKKVSEDS